MMEISLLYVFGDELKMGFAPKLFAALWHPEAQCDGNERTVIFNLVFEVFF